MSRRRSYCPMTCQNSECDFFLIEDGKDLIKNGRNSAGNQQYFCKHCRTYFTETKNTPLYHSRLGRQKVELICRLSQEKISIRGISRLTGHHPATIIRYCRLAGEHAALLTSHFLQRISVLIELKWMNSGHSLKKNKHCEGSYDRFYGDRWTYTAIRSTTKLLIAHHSGKRTDETCNQFIYLFSSRLRAPEPLARISIATDGNPQYLTALLKHIPKSAIDYGRVIEQHKENRVVAVIREKVLGNLTLASISTSVVEEYNNKIRQ